ncbi:MAG: glycosyl transferase [Bacteroidales bacterium]|nr:glycosyl transferase [Candidatus Colicola caccequi]
MIPKIIHYCWFGCGEMPELVRRCMASWHQFMPDWQYMCWNEDNFDIESAPRYVREAYEVRKYAFVSDYVRLWALEQHGGVYLDTDVEVIQPFDTLLDNCAFIGFEESKAKTLGTNVIGSEPHLSWLMMQMDYYNIAQFIRQDGTMDMTPNSEIIARNLVKGGLIRNGKEQVINYQSAVNNNCELIHVYDFHYFSPITSTRVMRKNKHTFSIHHCYGSWIGYHAPRELCDSIIVREVINALIQLKRLIIRK